MKCVNPPKENIVSYWWYVHKWDVCHHLGTEDTDSGTTGFTQGSPNKRVSFVLQHKKVLVRF